ncbi:MAG: hypothetical protein FWB96_02295 [Defluviitaleaceae bacterium]|nr:hypothetical protein [Defluviitaleaceae bacterium]MCL2262368.1 hypothetical protein [Defluviitaleaceae bacterium]
MANLTEITIAKKELLFDLLTLERENSGHAVKGLGRLIRKAKAGMSKEDIAYVVALVEEEFVK